MYSYSFDSKTGGIVLNSTPTNFSKEPRPVYAPEMNLLGFDKHWEYDKQADVPYMWAESNIYWYRGVQIAKIKGGNLYAAPELIIADDANETNPYWKQGTRLIPIDIEDMCAANDTLLDLMETTAVQRIIQEYEKFKDKLDVFHVAFSGGKDSAVLLDLIKKALPHDRFVVISVIQGWNFLIRMSLLRKQKGNVRVRVHRFTLLALILIRRILGRCSVHRRVCFGGAAVCIRVRRKR